METIEVTRKELYDIVWSTSLSKLTQQYALSNEGIKKLCKQFEIPMPDNGYWMKLKFNKAVKKPKFNSKFSGEDKITLTKREEGNLVNVDQTPQTIRTKEILSDPKAPLLVPDKLTKPDILIQNTESEHENRKKKDFYRNDKIDTVSIYVEENNYSRALRIMDSFIKLLRFRKHSFSRDFNNRGPLVDVKSLLFHFSIREKTKRVPSDKIYESSTYIPTGILILKIGESYKSMEWSDGYIKLEQQLAKIVAKIELEAIKELEWKETCRLNKIKREEEQKIRLEFEARKEKEFVKTKIFFSDSEKFNKTTIYRNYIKAIEQKAIAENNLTDELKSWIKWANDKANWFDPFINKTDDLLTEKDKEELFSINSSG